MGKALWYSVLFSEYWYAQLFCSAAWYPPYVLSAMCCNMDKTRVSGQQDHGCKG